MKTWKKWLLAGCAAFFCFAGTPAEAALSEEVQARISARQLANAQIASLLWMKTAAEYRALCYQGYNIALAAVDRALANPSARGGKPPAIVLDCDETVVTSNYMAAGAGPIKDVTHYFYDGDFDEDLGMQRYTPYFIVRKYNVGAKDYYQEFLFGNDGSLIFFFEKSGTDETRYYWGAEELAKEDIKGERLSDEVIATRLSQELKNAFDLLMNREF